MKSVSIVSGGAGGGEVLTLSQTDWFPLNWEAVQFGNWGYSGEDPDSRRNHD
jgi:hypothetical protein